MLFQLIIMCLCVCVVQGGFDYKKEIVDCIIATIEENPEAKEAGESGVVLPLIAICKIQTVIENQCCFYP